MSHIGKPRPVPPLFEGIDDRAMPLIGLGVMLPGGFAGEIIGGLGFDWAIVDLQHGANSWDSALATVQGLELGGTPAVIRIGWPNAQDVMRALDIGAQAVVVPMVNSVEDARMIARASKYPPLGERSMGVIRQSYGASTSSVEPLCFAMIETVAGLAAVEEIAAVPGIDGMFLGPGDLSLSMGIVRSRTVGSEIEAAARAMSQACRNHGKISGAFAPSAQAARIFQEAGVQILAVGTDVHLIADGAKLLKERVARADASTGAGN